MKKTNLTILFSLFFAVSLQASSNGTYLYCNLSTNGDKSTSQYYKDMKILEVTNDSMEFVAKISEIDENSPEGAIPDGSIFYKVEEDEEESEREINVSVTVHEQNTNDRLYDFFYFDDNDEIAIEDYRDSDFDASGVFYKTTTISGLVVNIFCMKFDSEEFYKEMSAKINKKMREISRI